MQLKEVKNMEFEYKTPRKMNKKGATFGVFTEIMLISILFVVALGIVGTNMNNLYGQNKDLSFGIASNDTLSNLKNTQSTLDTSLTAGTSSFSSLGVFTITTLPKMLLSLFSLIKDFVSGSWIRALIGLMNLGQYAESVIAVFQIMYFMAIIFIIFKLITRVNT